MSTDNTKVAGVALAVFCHPDDMEFCASGTLALLRRQGYDIHCLNVADGSCGSMTHGPRETAATRWKEAQDSAAKLGATMHPPLLPDLEIFYEDKACRRMAAAIRRIQPNIVITHAIEDYMEDHMITGRLALTGLFSAGIPNYRTDPEVPPYDKPRALYHALPHGLRRPRDGRREYPAFYIDVESVMDLKRAALACHLSQQSWLDSTQAMDNFLSAMEERAATLGADTGKFRFAEGFTRHLNIGMSDDSYQPLEDALRDYLLENEAYPQSPSIPK